MSLAEHSETKQRNYLNRPKPFPNPYIEGKMNREIIPEINPWLGNEERKGWGDIRLSILRRDNFTCQWLGCGRRITLETGEVDHKRPRHVFGWKPDADKPNNLWTLCQEHHAIKTQNDRELESRVR